MSLRRASVPVRCAALCAGALLCLAAPAGAKPKAAATVRSYRTRPDLRPAAIAVQLRAKGRAPGYVALAPKGAGVDPGALLADDRGRTVWFAPSPTGDLTTDFRVQTYRGRPVLTWWEGKFVSPGSGQGRGVIYDDRYHLVKRVYAGHGYSMDLHEFRLTPAGTALVIAYHSVAADLSSVGGPRNGTVVDGIVQEIDVATGKVRFEWHTLGHVALSESFVPAPRDKSPFDYAHLNSVEQEPDGDLLVSARNTSTLYEVQRSSGRVLWRLGGHHGDFHMGRGARFAFQHDARRQPDGTLTLFDNGSRRSRALRLAVDTVAMTATEVGELRRPVDAFATSQGDAQAEPGGSMFVGWGALGVFSEFDPAGRIVFDASLPTGVDTYRAYKVRWTGRPLSHPAVTAAARRGTTTIRVSWNGATDIAAWRVLRGATAGRLAAAVTARKRSFETKIRVGGVTRYVELQALDAAGKVLGRSAAVRVR